MKLRAGIFLAAVLLLAAGCVPAPLIFAGASGGAVYSTTSDHITDVVNVSKEEAFEIMIGVITSEDGRVTLSSISEGKIEARIGKSLIFVSLTPLTENSAKLSIRAKKHNELIPDKDASIRVYKKFIKEAQR